MQAAASARGLVAGGSSASSPASGEDRCRASRVRCNGEKWACKSCPDRSERRSCAQGCGGVSRQTRRSAGCRSHRVVLRPGRRGGPTTTDNWTCRAERGGRDDFTGPAASLPTPEPVTRRGVPRVIWYHRAREAGAAELEALARTAAVVLAPNMSLGVNLLLRLAELAARALPASYDAEIFEAHHRDKVDAPSGTALAPRARQGRERTWHDPRRVGGLCTARRNGPRSDGAIGFSVLRAGDIVGEHRLVFAGRASVWTLAHLAQDRSGFARGALAAAAGWRPAATGTLRHARVLGL